MPATTLAQQKFMGMCTTSEGRAKARGKCPPLSVAREFARKPTGKTLPEKAKKRSFSD